MAPEAWMIEESEEDQRLSHHRIPKEFVSWDKLAGIGVVYWHLDPKKPESGEELKKIREARGYSYMDYLELSPGKIENYDEKLKNFYREHMHADEEIRYCLEGSGFFDVRDEGDTWIRIWIKEGDMIVLPAGLYHRFTLDTSNYVKCAGGEVGYGNPAPPRPRPVCGFGPGHLLRCGCGRSPLKAKQGNHAGSSGLVEITREKGKPSFGSSDRLENESWEHPAFGRRRLAGPGSSPPTCRSKCGRCFPCRAVHIAIQPGHFVPLEYYPEAWRCKCGNKLFMP
ncbi:1,2-dihydroxy-3-keto-5-methylthiopentene dioxygenase 1 [Apostasia shenzhenica]|uniref:Acireductone dioxygenase n=1 Tax=Apostasia shenzhenica TaxID=1088818 RepID=A0A2I0B0T5_9ASPA|nr:1,2-dihydroxy-3-keto-5-methylthiopentene dioxygenase 1 [Apostasia shenzhenica]